MTNQKVADDKGAKQDELQEQEERKDNKRIDELESKIAELDNNWRRALADYQNLVKRTQNEKADIALYGNQNIILKFLDILDHLEEAQKHVSDKGIELVIKLFRDALKSEGVSEIECKDCEFNPEFHECVDKRVGEKNNVIIEVVKKGYMLKDRVLRPAKVIVEVNK